MQRKLITLVLLGALLMCPVAYAADIEGRWLLSVQDKKRTLVGLLEIEKVDEGWIAYLEGGPASVATDGDNVVIVADSRDVRGFVFNRRMTGKIDGDSMSGTYAQEGAAAQAEAPGPWRAVREPVQATMAKAAKPADLSGIWTATQELDFRKYTMALTPAGEKWLESYLPFYDQPDVRCTSIGLPALTTYSFPFEIIASEDRLTMIYEYQSKVRRIWMDGRAAGEYMPPSRMGHSNGHWDGSTLVIEIVAGRILAPDIGVSIYTWTSIIGVVLAGISIGAYLGGMAADRFPQQRTLGLILLAGGLSSLSVLPLVGVASSVFTGLPLVARIVFLTASLSSCPA